MWIGTAILLVVAAAMPAPAAQDKPDANGKAAPAAEQKKSAADRGKKDASAPQSKSTPTAPKRVTEADGKTYEYRETPFGLMKFPVKAGDAASEVPTDALPKVVEEGDSLRFRRQTPFGVTEWVRKKSELNDTEKQAWERELNRAKNSAPVTTKDGK